MNLHSTKVWVIYITKNYNHLFNSLNKYNYKVKLISLYKIPPLKFQQFPEVVVINAIDLPQDKIIQAINEIKNRIPKTIILTISQQENLKSIISQELYNELDIIFFPCTIEQIDFSIRKAILKKNKEIEKNLLIYQKLEKVFYTQRTVQNKLSEPNGHYLISKEMIGKSPIMQNLFNKLPKIAQSDSNIMIYGESGTGKELLARNIHKLSKRRNNEFIAIDCVALPETLMESELFGYEKGAFTGATSRKKGLFEYADKGTLFLDEICELPLNLQAKLLRVIQEREFRRLGSQNLIKMDVRIICATNKKPIEAVKDGSFRKDLFYRLNVIPIELPPLRERPEDIPLIFNHYLEKFCVLAGITTKLIDPSAMEILMKYNWPGNVRELRNLAERFVYLNDSEIIRVEDLPGYIKKKTALKEFKVLDLKIGLPFIEAKKKILADFEKEYFKSLLEKYKGNLSQAAKYAKISRRTLYRMINLYNLQKFV